MNKHMLKLTHSLGRPRLELLPGRSFCMEGKPGEFFLALDGKIAVGRLRNALGFPAAPILPLRETPCADAQSPAAGRLGIRLEQDIRREDDSLAPGYPLLAACYSRFGLIRLSGKRRP